MHGDAWEARKSMIDAWACMGGRGKHERRMGMHGEARESMKDAWGGMEARESMGKHERRMGMHGHAWGCMGMHGEALGSEDIELPSVLIVGAEGLEVFGSHAEHEIVSEDRVVVLEDGGDLSLGLAFQVKAD